MSKDECEVMDEALKLAEAQKIVDSLEKGLNEVKNNKTQAIETLWDKLSG